MTHRTWSSTIVASNQPPSLMGTPQYVAFADNLSIEAVADLERSFAPASHPEQRSLVLDLTGVSQMSNSVLVALCSSLRRMRSQNTTVVIAGLDPRARHLLGLLGLGDIELVDAVPEGVRVV